MAHCSVMVTLLLLCLCCWRHLEGFPTVGRASGITVPKSSGIKEIASSRSFVGTAWNATAAAVNHFSPHKVFGSIFGMRHKYSKLGPYDRLATVPVYYLSSPQGYGYVQSDAQSGDPHQKVITYFMSSDDASNYLNEMVQASPHGVNEYRLYTSTLDTVLSRIYAKKQSRKFGRMPISNILRIQVSVKLC
jgi:hypothetical protein